VFEGPWAFFRLVDAAAIAPQSEVRFLLNIRAGGRNARLQIDASSIRNPFGGSALSRFRCGG
jgi:type VI secretion system protein ImpL